jgi:glyceraldehyde-3-phosphate dehydrogenase (NADP+)
MYLMKCALRRQFPCQGSEIGDYLTQHAGVDCISFTGGDTGVSIARKAGMVPLQMELGGKDACIICRSA